jgi:isocitrate dehydrogenase (NAD+)
MSGNKLQGLNVANPTGLILASTNMLINMGLPRFGALIKQAVKNVYSEGKYLTKDVGGLSTASDFTKRLVDEIKFLDSGKVFGSS